MGFPHLRPVGDILFGRILRSKIGAPPVCKALKPCALHRGQPADIVIRFKRGIPGCVVSGPLALDGAISMESVKHKGIHDPVAGQADILLVPFIEIGNVLYKSITYIAGKTMASTICGASCPVIITSRADTPDSKYYSILLAVLRCLKA